MGGTRSGLTMRERVRLGEPRPEPPDQPCPGRHCWVVGAGLGETDGVKTPGLLVEWRRTPSGWEGRVVYLARLAPARWALVEEWLPAEALAPA